MAMAGIREVLVYAENEKKTVTVTAGSAVAIGKVIRVNPLIVQQDEGKGVIVIDFDSIQTVSIMDASGDEVVNACKPQTEAKFTGSRRF
jgi:hypothetical protein